MRKTLVVMVILLAGLLAFAPASQAITTPSNYYAWIGTVDFNNDQFNDYTGADGTTGSMNNTINQTIFGSSLSVWYNFYSWDYSPFDDPGFAIMEYNFETEQWTTLFSLSAGDIDTDPEEQTSLDSTGWQLFTYDWGEEGEHGISFFAGNTLDNSLQSWVFLDMANPFNNGDFETGDLTDWNWDGQAGVSDGSSAVPIPGAVWLLGSGLFGLMGVKRRYIH